MCFFVDILLYTYIAGVVELSIFHFFTVRSLRQSHRWMLMMNFNSTNFRLSREREQLRDSIRLYLFASSWQSILITSIHTI